MLPRTGINEACDLLHPSLDLKCTVQHAVDKPLRDRLHAAFHKAAMCVMIWPTHQGRKANDDAKQ